MDLKKLILTILKKPIKPKSMEDIYKNCKKPTPIESSAWNLD